MNLCVCIVRTRQAGAQLACLSIHVISVAFAAGSTNRALSRSATTIGILNLSNFPQMFFQLFRSIQVLDKLGTNQLLQLVILFVWHRCWHAQWDTALVLLTFDGHHEIIQTVLILDICFLVIVLHIFVNGSLHDINRTLSPTCESIFSCIIHVHIRLESQFAPCIVSTSSSWPLLIHLGRTSTRTSKIDFHNEVVSSLSSGGLQWGN